MKARDGIEAQRGLNDVWPGDEYPEPNSNAEKIDPVRGVLERCRTVLGNMALENEGRARIFRRWQISDEPLRNDAKNLLPLIDEILNR
jgi:hypothetical protein